MDERDERAESADRDHRDKRPSSDGAQSGPGTVWASLLSGHFSLVERIEQNGSTCLVARRNDPRGPALTFRERACVAWAVRGLVDVEISREMKLPVPTVQVHLANAAQKLGIRSRSALVSAAAAFVDVETT